MVPVILALLTASASDASRDDVRRGADEVLTLYNAQDFDAAHARALRLVVQAARLEQDDVLRLRAEARLADSLVGLDRVAEAAAAYQQLYDRIEVTSVEHLALAVELASNLGACHQLLGDLGESLAWHQAAWSMLTEHQLYHPIRFVVAAQFADAAVAASDLATARTLREWIVVSLVNESAAPARIAAARLGLAEVHLAAAQLDAAAELLDQALPVLEQADASLLPKALAMAGDVAIQQGELRRARPLIERAYALDVARFGAEDPRVYDSLASVASLDALAGRHQQARQVQQRLVELVARARGERHYATARQRGALAVAHLELDELDQARDQIERALQAVGDRDTGDPVVLELTGIRVSVDIAQGRVGPAIDELRRILTGLADVEAARATRPVYRSQLAYALQLSGALDEADRTYAAALGEAEAVLGPEHPETANVVNGLAALLLERGRYEDAEAWLRRALRAMERSLGPSNPALLGALNNLSLARSAQGDPVEAAELLERGIAIATAAFGEAHPSLAIEMANLGGLLLDRGDLVGAERWLARSLALRQEAVDAGDPRTVPLLMRVAGLRLRQGRAAAGEELARRALQVASSLGEDHPDLVAPLHTLADLALRDGRLDEADALATRAEALARAVGQGADPRGEAAAGLQRVNIDLARGDVAGALARARRLEAQLPDTVGATERIRLDVESAIASLAFRAGAADEARARIAEVVRSEEQGLLRVLGTLSARERLALARAYRSNLFELLWIHAFEGGDPEAAYAAWLRFRGIASRSLAVEQPALLAEAAPETYARWQAARAELARLSVQADTDVGRLAALTERKEALRRELARAGAERRPPVETTTPAALCRQIPTDGVLVDYVRRRHVGQTPDGTAYDELVTAFVLDATCTLRREELGPAPAVDAAVARYHALLASGSSSARVDRQGSKVRELIWDPLRIEPDREQVFVVPDGPLATVSFAALPVDGQPLVARHTFRFLDNALEVGGRPGVPPRGALVVGDLVYGPPAETRGLCVPSFPPLPGTAVEVEQLAARLGATVLRGSDATAAALRAGLAEASTVHLATHGYFAGACVAEVAGVGDAVALNPMVLSGLALSNANQDPEAIWTAETVATLPLGHVDLVVLSACESGLGTLESGEGVMGLRRAFSLGGARATVMSLWSVPDASTQRLMDGFYAALGADPRRDEARALRAAQLQLRESNLAQYGEARPETWAAFVVGGPPRRAP